MREIRIRKLDPYEARNRLETDLNSAFMSGETRVRIIHGIGSGKLKKLAEEVVGECGFARAVESEVYPNPGVLTVDLFPPDRGALRMMKK